MVNVFNVEEQTEKVINWIKDWFEHKAGNAKGIVIGISGGKDSSVVAGLCVKALGKDKVLGVLMPNGEQPDIEDSIELCEFLGIEYRIVNIAPMVEAFYSQIRYSPKYCENDIVENLFPLSTHTQTNIPPRVRMTVLYAIGQELGYRVAGTGNWNETYIGYSTKWGDGACDFNPIKDFLVEEVIAIGDYLGIKEHLVHKAPADGLCGKTDEDNLGFPYSAVSEFKYKGYCANREYFDKIINMHYYNLHKNSPIPYYQKK